MTARLIIYGNLTDFLGPGPRPRALEFVPLPHAQLKDTIESFEVPHCEVDQLLVNGEPAPFTRRARPGDLVEVFPVHDGAPARPSFVRPPDLPELKFVVDCNLGKLNSMMRSLGFDCYYENHIPDARAARVSAAESRILLTKDRRLLKRAIITYGYWVRSEMPSDQVREVLRRFRLEDRVKLLSRCIDCNVNTIEVDKERVLDRLEPLTKKYYDRFFMCPKCEKVFWRGSHFEKIKAWRDSLATASEPK
ncbi:MAG TPA: Mut7-C RNAse domain-containing protein [Bdellovibrionales bacterium]|nr:Mut7-C RNAse domain-containing protein [Bdellovibrionales bacterium]